MKVILYIDELNYRRYKLVNVFKEINKPYFLEHQIIENGMWVSVYGNKFNKLGSCPNLRMVYDNVDDKVAFLIIAKFSRWKHKNNIPSSYGHHELVQ